MQKNLEPFLSKNSWGYQDKTRKRCFLTHLDLETLLLYVVIPFNLGKFFMMATAIIYKEIFTRGRQAQVQHIPSKCNRFSLKVQQILPQSATDSLSLAGLCHVTMASQWLVLQEGETGRGWDRCKTSHSALDGGIAQTPNDVAIIINFQLILSCFVTRPRFQAPKGGEAEMSWNGCSSPVNI